MHGEQVGPNRRWESDELEPTTAAEKKLFLAASMGRLCDLRTAAERHSRIGYRPWTMLKCGAIPVWFAAPSCIVYGGHSVSLVGGWIGGESGSGRRLPEPADR